MIVFHTTVTAVTGTKQSEHRLQFLQYSQPGMVQVTYPQEWLFCKKQSVIRLVVNTKMQASYTMIAAIDHNELKSSVFISDW